MFVSLNKKFFFTIFIFLLLTASIFLIIFDGVIGQKIRAEHSHIITRNQYVIELLNENILLRKRISALQPTEQIYDNLSKKQEELSRERLLNEELNQNYNENYATLAESLRIISFGAILTLIALIVLWFLLRRWVISPLDKLTVLSTAVANGDFTQRLQPNQNLTNDEFDILSQTINFMLDNMENNINEIKQKELYLQNLIDALPDAIRVIDKDYNIILSNKAYTEHIKQNYFYNTDKCYLSYDKKADCPCNNSRYICPLSELQKSTSSTLKLIHSVNERPLSVNSARININGKFAIVESFRDLSENIHYSHQQKISSLGFLATSLAHEMKNNLGAINLILNGLLEKYYTDDNMPEEKKYLQMITKQIAECILVPERLLKLSRETNQSITNFNIINSIQDILSLFDYEIKSKGIFLKQDFANKKEMVHGNETDFKMIILNLIQNAINSMPHGGTLEVKTHTLKNAFTISIKDSGCGISETALKHIFEPFYSVSHTDKKGTGLGLAIVKDLISQFNAKINVTSKENVGSDFELTFPRQK